jgi:glycosyltransferase involved in cell wall biosynthesis
MSRVLIAAPFDTKGRYEGGISSVVKGFIDETKMSNNKEIEFCSFNTCVIERNESGSGRLNAANLKNFYQMYKTIVSSIKEQKADILYFHTSTKYALLKDLLSVRHAKKKAKVKTIIHIHFAEYRKIMTNKKIVDRVIIGLLKKYADHIVFLSRTTKEEFLEHGISESKCSVVYNFSTLKCSKEEIALKEANRNFLFVGSVDMRKGLFDLLDVLSNTKEDFCLYVCGGFANEDCKKKFEFYEAKMGDKLRFLGYVSGDQKKEIFLNSSVLFLPSYGEGLPMVILEAFSAGCIVVTTTVGAIPEVVCKEHGYVVSPGDKMAINDAILKYFNTSLDDIKKQQFNNYLYSEKFTIQEFTAQTINICNKVRP